MQDAENTSPNSVLLLSFLLNSNSNHLPCSTEFRTMRTKQPQHDILIDYVLINTYSMKQPDLYYFEAIKMTSQA